MRTEGLELRALVPVSVRAKDEHGDLGNRIVVMRGPLPVYVEDPVARLRVVRHAMDGPQGAPSRPSAPTRSPGWRRSPRRRSSPRPSRLQFSTRLFNLLVTNVPGPQFPLYVLGRELEDLFPVAFLPENQSLAVAVMSYNGRMDFGLLGDYDALHRHRGLRAGAARLAGRAHRGRGRQAAAPPPRGHRGLTATVDTSSRTNRVRCRRAGAPAVVAHQASPRSLQHLKNVEDRP